MDERWAMDDCVGDRFFCTHPLSLGLPTAQDGPAQLSSSSTYNCSPGDTLHHHTVLNVPNYSAQTNPRLSPRSQFDGIYKSRPLSQLITDSSHSRFNLSPCVVRRCSG
jgi:hypothetical protein